MKKKILAWCLAGVILAGLAMLHFATFKTHTENNLITTEEKAKIVGIAYMKVKYPEFDFDGNDYEYLILYNKKELAWTVYSFNDERSCNMPMACFKTNGEIVYISLQAD